MKTLAFSLFLILSVQVQAAQPQFEFFCNELLQKQPSLSDYSAYFTENFQKKVPLEYLKSIFLDLYKDVGACTSYKVITASENKYQLILHGDKKIEALFSVSWDGSTSLFNGLLLNGVNDPAVQIKSWSDVQASLQKLDSQGKLSATLKTSDGVVNLVFKESEVFGIGSTFKLYILGALVQSIAHGEHQWDDILPLKEEWKSLPSGVMQDWPAEKPVKLYEYAEKMISVSDNTATDHLLYFLRRENVEKMLEPMGNSHEPLFLPFLSTLEMFKLKWAMNPVATQNYLQKDVSERRKILNSLSEIPRSQVGTNGVDYNKPTLIDRLEWFATTPENCDAMFWLASQNNSSVRFILSKNVPLLDEVGSDHSHWAYAGFKGGSEPGVLNLTFLLESKKGSRACLAMSWNNSEENISQNRFIDLVRKTLEFAETQIP